MDIIALPAAAPIGQWHAIAEMLRATRAPVVTTALEPECAPQRWVQWHHRRVGRWLGRRGWRSRVAAMSAVDVDWVLTADAFADRRSLGSRIMHLVPHGLLLAAWSRGLISAGSKATTCEWFHTPELHRELLQHHTALIADEVSTRRETTAALPWALADLLERELRLRGWRKSESKQVDING